MVKLAWALINKAVVVVGNRVLGGVDKATLGVDIIVLDVDKIILGAGITIVIFGDDIVAMRQRGEGGGITLDG